MSVIHKEMSRLAQSMRHQAKIDLETASTLVKCSPEMLEKMENGSPIPLSFFSKMVAAYKISENEAMIEILRIQKLVWSMRVH